MARLPAIDESWNKLLSAYGYLDSTPDAPSVPEVKDGFERGAPAQHHGPTHRIDPGQAYTFNMYAAESAKAEAFAFGRRSKQRTVVKSEPSGASGQPPHQRVGQADLPIPSFTGSMGLPRYRPPRPQLTWEEAAAYVSAYGRKAAENLARGLVAPRGPAPTPAAQMTAGRGPLSTGDVFVSSVTTAAQVPEVTDPHFQWPAQSAFAAHADGAIVEGGTSPRRFFDAERTTTYFGRPYPVRGGR